MLFNVLCTALLRHSLLSFCSCHVLRVVFVAASIAAVAAALIQISCFLFLSILNIPYKSFVCVIVWVCVCVYAEIYIKLYRVPPMQTCMQRPNQFVLAPIDFMFGCGLRFLQTNARVKINHISRGPAKTARPCQAGR